MSYFDEDWSPRFWDHGVHPKHIIVLHTTENVSGTPARNVAQYQLSSKTGSYHMLVDSTGHRLRENTDEQCVWGCGNYGNKIGLQLSFVATASWSTIQWLNHETMLHAGAKVVAYWCNRYNIPVTRLTTEGLRRGEKGITDHNGTRLAWAGTTHTDVGDGFPWEMFLRLVAQELGEGGDTTMKGRDSGMEKTLPYRRDQVRQDTGYWCGPASAQTIIRAATGKLVSEGQLARDMGTTTGGTNHIGLVQGALRKYVAGGNWTVVQMPNDPPSAAQREKLWADIKRSVDAGFGVAANIVAPPSNYPRPSYTSNQKLQYRGGTVYHYVALMGYAVDSKGGRHVWWADSGFYPYGCWVTLEQTASLIPPKGYCYANNEAPKAEGGKHAQTGGESMDATLATVKDNQVQLRGPDFNGWSVPDLVAAAGRREGDRGTVPELLSVILTEVRSLRDDVSSLRKVA